MTLKSTIRNQLKLSDLVFDFFVSASFHKEPRDCRFTFVRGLDECCGAKLVHNNIRTQTRSAKSHVHNAIGEQKNSF
jgi:hypothetical protein